jgi:WhiB family redox-sensing transcriptional regulator
MERDGWRSLAACKGAEPDLWFPEPGEDARPALAVCDGCPVRRECLADALHAPEKFGIWGGLPEVGRRAIRRQGRRGAA